MANTGKKIILTLKEIDTNAPGDPPRSTKANNIGDVDYVAPYVDTEDCPIVYDTTCPLVVLIDKRNYLLFEFSLKDTVVKNPAIDKIKIDLMSGGSSIENQSYDAPFTSNYFSGFFVKPAAGTYSWTVSYLDSSDVVLKSCSDLSTFTI